MNTRKVKQSPNGIHTISTNQNFTVKDSHIVPCKCRLAVVLRSLYMNINIIIIKTILDYAMPLMRQHGVVVEVVAVLYCCLRTKDIHR